MRLAFSGQSEYNTSKRCVTVAAKVSQQWITVDFSRTGICDFFGRPDTGRDAVLTFGTHRSQLIHVAQTVYETDPAAFQNNTLFITVSHIKQHYPNS